MLGALAEEFSLAGLLRGDGKGEPLRPISVIPDDGLDGWSSEPRALTRLFLCVSGSPSELGVRRAFLEPRLKALRGDGGGFRFEVGFVGELGRRFNIWSSSLAPLSDLEGKKRELRIEVILPAVSDLLLVVSCISVWIG